MHFFCSNKKYIVQSKSKVDHTETGMRSGQYTVLNNNECFKKKVHVLLVLFFFFFELGVSSYVSKHALNTPQLLNIP